MDIFPLFSQFRRMRSSSAEVPPGTLTIKLFGEHEPVLLYDVDDVRFHLETNTVRITSGGTELTFPIRIIKSMKFEQD